MATHCRWHWRTLLVTCVVPEWCFIRSGLRLQLAVLGSACLAHHVWWSRLVPVVVVALWGRVPSVKLSYIQNSLTSPMVGNSTSLRLKTFPYELNSLLFPPPDYDIALLRLEEPLKFDVKVRALCLPGSVDFTGANASLTKWGLGEDNYATYTVDRIQETPVWDLTLVWSFPSSSL